MSHGTHRTRHRRGGAAALLSFLLVSLLTITVPAAADPAFRAVAVTGQPAPDAGGRPFTRLGTPSINDAGQVAFGGAVPSSDARPAPAGIWSGLPGAVHLNAIEGQPSPINDQPYAGLSDAAAINALGDVLFSTTFSPEANALLLGRAGERGSPRVVAATFQQAPQVREKQFFNVIDTTPRLGPGGHAAFVARLHGKEIETDVNDSGLWAGPPDGLQLVARAGQQAPGTPEGVHFRRSQFSSGNALHAPAVDRDGNVVFIGHVDGPGVDWYNDSGIWFGSGDKLRLLAREGEAAIPDTFVNYQIFGTPPTVASGRVAFRAVLYGPPPGDGGADRPGGVSVQSDSEPIDAIVAGRPGAMKVVATTHSRPGGADFRVMSFGAPSINSPGQLMYTARLEVDSGQVPVEQHSLWSTSAGTRSLLFRTGDAAPGAGPGTTFHYFADPSVNDAGQYAFLGELRGGSLPDGQDVGVWLGDIDGDGRAPSLLARTGQSLDLGDGVLRTISGLDFTGGSNGGENGAPSGLNHLGQVSFLAHFTDGSSAVLVAGVPEPAAAGVMLFVLAGLGLRRRRWKL